MTPTSLATLGQIVARVLEMYGLDGPAMFKRDGIHPALIPPPRIHRHRYHGVLAPNSAYRSPVTALARAAAPPSPQPLTTQASPAHPPQRPERSPARILWALLLARIYEIFPLRCTLCGAQMRIIAFLTEPPAVKTILRHLGEATTPPEVARARGPPLWDESAEFLPHWADSPAPVPEFVFDQRLGW